MSYTNVIRNFLNYKLQQSNVIDIIKTKSHSWVGGIVRLIENAHARRILNTESDGKRRSGKPRLTWTNRVEDFRTLDFRN